MALSLGAMLAIQAGGAIAGKLASEAFGPDDSVPDLVSPYNREIDRSRMMSERRRSRLFDKMSGDARARGLSSSQETAMKQGLISESNEDISRMDSRAAEIIGSAVNRQRLIEFQRNAQKKAAMQQGIMEGLQGVGSYMAMQGLLNPGEDGATGSAPLDPSLALDFSSNTGALTGPDSGALNNFGLQEQFDPLTGMLTIRPSLRYRPPGQ